MGLIVERGVMVILGVGDLVFSLWSASTNGSYEITHMIRMILSWETHYRVVMPPNSQSPIIWSTVLLSPPWNTHPVTNTAARIVLGCNVNVKVFELV